MLMVFRGQVGILRNGIDPSDDVRLEPGDRV